MQGFIDYSNYQISLKEELKCITLTFLLSLVAAWVLYKSFWGLFLWIIIFPLYRRNYKRRKIQERKRDLLLQFKDGMQSVSVALLSGYSIENAWREAEKELQDLYGTGTYMVEEMRLMNSGIRMNQPVEQLLYQFALRSSCEEIMEFAEVFQFAKRSGGNFGKIIQNTTFKICEKIDVEREIQTVIAGKKMEQKVMNAVPVCLLAYLNLTSGDFLEPLYGNFFGGCVMSVAFAAYVAALLLAQKVVDIKV